MSEEERIRRAEIIAERRNSRIPASNINNREKTKLSALAKVSIQILTSICLFGLCYFLYQNNSYAIEVIKPVISADTDFQKLYSNINEVVKNLMQEENTENNEQKQEEENTENIENTQETPETISEVESDASYIKRTTQFVKPITGTITSRFGEREKSEIVSSNHAGVDIGSEQGSEIKASMKGIAEKVSDYGDYGKHIIISNGDISTLYAHCSEILVKEGDEIEQGTIIAKVGSTGKSTGPHLHFEIRRNDIPVNPEEILELD